MKTLSLRRRQANVVPLVRGVAWWTRLPSADESIRSTLSSGEFTFGDNSMFLEKEWSKSMTFSTKDLLSDYVDEKEELHMSLSTDEGIANNE